MVVDFFFLHLMSRPVPLQIRLPSALVNVVYIYFRNELQIPMLTVKMFEKKITRNDENARGKNKYETVRGKEEKPLQDI